MVATNLKAETMSLMDKRSAIEEDMNVIIERLSQPGGPGLSGNLLDSEGFPRNDIDIPAVRADRHRLAVLRNDHKDITEKINQNIQLLHSAKLASKSPLSRDFGVLSKCGKGSPEEPLPLKWMWQMVPFQGKKCNTEESDNESQSVGVGVSSSSPNVIENAVTAMDLDVNVSIPFALVDEISEASPAAEDGLQLGDQIVKFGNVESGDNLLPKLASEAQSNQGHGISVVVLRQCALINLTITPRVWQGRGLLGCHFRIL